MNDFLLISISLVIFSVIGYFPCLLLPEQDFKERLLIAPVVGFGITGVCLTILYRFGLQPVYSLIIIFSLSVSGLIYYFLKQKIKLYLNVKKTLIYLFIISFTILLSISPKLIGDKSISIIQGVPSDFINYVVEAYVYQNYSYKNISNIYTDIDNLNNINMYSQYFYFGKISLGQRPTVSITLASLSKFFFKSNSLAAYSYMVLMQINMLFVSVFTLINIFNTRRKIALIISFALTVGFYQQFAFDIDAWSELSSLPLNLLTITLIVIFLHSFDRDKLSNYYSFKQVMIRYSLFNAFIFTSLLYYYPEILFINFCSISFVFLINSYLINKVKIISFKLLSIFITFLITLILGSLFYQGSLGYFIQLLNSFFSDIHYHEYKDIGFFGFILGRDSGQNSHIFNDFITHLYSIFLMPINVIMSIFGLNFLIPKLSFGIIPNIIIRITYYIFSITLLYWVLKSISLTLKNRIRSKESLFYIASIGALFIPIILLYKNNYWVAGKAITYIFSLIFFILLSPLLTKFKYIKFKKKSEIILYIYIILYMSFGFIRPIAATHKFGILYSSPYPGDPTAHANFTWDIEDIDKSTKDCKILGIDIDNDVLEMFVENFIDDSSKNIFNLSTSSQFYPLWFELRNRHKSFWIFFKKEFKISKPITTPDCLITTDPSNRYMKIKKTFNLLRNP